METKSPLIEKEEVVENVMYSESEEKYLGALRKRMESARDIRDGLHEEFDGMGYVDYYNSNEQLANTYIAPKRNKQDTNYQSGTIRQKLFALLSPIVNLNLSGDISAFGADGLQIQALGDAMEDVMLKTNELDTDDEKKLLRHLELMKQGTVFVEELWDDRDKKVKKLSKKFDGKISSAQWSTKIKKAFARPTRNIIPGLNVYLGDITKYGIQDQPYIFTVDHLPYQEAESIFGTWERWENVPKKLAKWDEGSANGTIQTSWLLTENSDDYVEIIRYQDKWNNEYAVLLNGVLMTPVGLPLPWGYEDYNIAQQNAEPIHAKFAYGKSLAQRIKNKVAILDEMERLAVLKTQKSFMPPYVNVSGRVVSNRVLMPGVISYGIAPNTLVPINDKETQGVTQAEFNMIQMVKDDVNSETTSPTFQGQRESGNPTATEIIELQRQAKLMLGITIFAVSMLEWKLEWLRLQNILANWFVPYDKEVDEARSILKDKYRQVSTQHMIEGEGMGQRIVIPTSRIPQPEAIMQAEDMLSKTQGMPIRLVFLNPEEVCSSKLAWQIVVRPKERKTSEVSKLMFRAFMQDAAAFGPMLNWEELKEEFANVWEKNPKKLFMSEEQMQLQQMQQAAMQPPEAGGGSSVVSPGTNLPSPESAMGQELKTALRTQ